MQVSCRVVPSSRLRGGADKILNRHRAVHRPPQSARFGAAVALGREQPGRGRQVRGGGGTVTPDGSHIQPLGRGGDPISDDRLDGKYTNLGHDGGGGTFADVWSPQNRLRRFHDHRYEHARLHLRGLGRASRAQRIRARQRPEREFLAAPDRAGGRRRTERYRSADQQFEETCCSPTTHAYRGPGLPPARSAIKIYNSTDIRFHNLHSNAESGAALCSDDVCGTYLRASKLPFQNAIEDVTAGIFTREREFAKLHITGAQEKPEPSRLAGAGELRKIAGGFFSISGATAAPDGSLYSRPPVPAHPSLERGAGVESYAPSVGPAISPPIARATAGRVEPGKHTTVYSIDPNGRRRKHGNRADARQG